MTIAHAYGRHSVDIMPNTDIKFSSGIHHVHLNLFYCLLLATAKGILFCQVKLWKVLSISHAKRKSLT